MAQTTVKVNPIQNKLLNAVVKNNVALINKLVNQGANVDGENKYGMTPLVAAVSYRNFESAKALLELGADPNLGVHGFVDYGYKLPTYDTPLHLADWETDSINEELAEKAKQMVKLLKKFGARA